MRSPILIGLLALVLAPAALAQSSDSMSLGDVARQSRAHAVTPKRVFDDQNDDFGRAEDTVTPCGEPIASFPAGYVPSVLEPQVADPQVGKALLKWLERHPDLDLMHPEDLAHIKFPRSAAQAEANQQLASAAADRWIEEVSPAAQQGDAEKLHSGVDSIMKSSEAANSNSALAEAVRIEQQRRIRSDGSTADKLREATNLYSICEIGRQAQSQAEIENLAKQYFQKRLSQLVANVAPQKQTEPGPPQKGN